MELITESDSYVPCIDDFGNYIDKIPSCNVLQRGILCPCGSRKDKLYNSYSIFSGHVKTKTHQKWLVNLNLNKANFYIENENLKNTLQSQRIIIAKLDKELQNKNMTIDYLTQQLVNKNNFNKVDLVNDLLSFD
jgi:predicted RNase H-like nuclease (RuvC/YqgF family)